MKKIYDIPNPCTENWNAMTPGDKRRFCNTCEKVVIDFTKMSTDDILFHLKVNKNTCGHFSKHQLDRLNTHIENNRFSIPKFAGFFALAAILGINSPTIANTTFSKIEFQKDTTWRSVLPKKLPVNDSITISGRVLDEDGLPLPSANVVLKGTRHGTLTDFDGNFSMILTKEQTEKYNTLVVSYVGFITENVSINSNLKTITLTFDLEYAILGEVVIKRNIFQRTGDFFKNLFSKKQH